MSNCWIAGSGAAAAFRWETENSNGANENSGSTGPFFDNTTFGVVGGMYLYLETSSGVAGDSAFFTSPDIDLTGLTTPQLSFAYHMYGATTGTLSAQVWNGSTWQAASIVGGTVTSLSVTGDVTISSSVQADFKQVAILVGNLTDPASDTF